MGCYVTAKMKKIDSKNGLYKGFKAKNQKKPPSENTGSSKDPAGAKRQTRGPWWPWFAHRSIIFGRGSPKELSCEIISKSVHRFSRRNRLKLFPIYSPGGHFVQLNEAV